VKRLSVLSWAGFYGPSAFTASLPLMIDLHCHMLPAMDDGAADLPNALEMARLAIADGICVTACTPHIYPGLYDNSAAGIRQALDLFKEQLAEAGLALRLVEGADTHLVPELLQGLRTGRVPTLNSSRYLLLEPPHHVAPPRLEESCFALLTGGYLPIITHPERLTWIGEHYSRFQELARRGIWMQITAGSLLGRFGSEARYFAERMLDEGLVHILATDAHSPKHRPPVLAEGRRAAERWVGIAEAGRLVVERPQAILDDVDPVKVAAPPGLRDVGADTPNKPSFWTRWFGR
jgi:protein-tyrosine phosphatase